MQQRSAMAAQAEAEGDLRDLAWAVPALAGGRVTPRDLVEVALARIAEADPVLGLFAHVDAAGARAAADLATREIAAGGMRSPLHGLPYAVKDNYDVAGLPARAGSRLQADRVAGRDAALVARLRAAGAICLGKLSTWEYGTGDAAEHFDLPAPPARNPWDPERFTGGSSTGSGAAVAAGMAAFALGSDTTGSVRLPAAATGTLGMIATQGRLPLAGILPNCHSLDVPGLFAWDAQGAALVLETLTGGAVPVPAVPDLAGWRIGVIEAPGPGFPDPDPALAAAFATGLRRLESLGARLVPMALPVPAAECFELTRMIGPVESAAIHEDDLRASPGLMGRGLRNKLLGGMAVRAVDYVNAQRRRTEVAAAIDATLERCDALVCFGALHLPPRLGVEPEMSAFTCETMLTPFNLAGCPALVQATGMTEGGLPTHWQVVAARGAEGRALALARAHDAAMPARLRPPRDPQPPARPAPSPAAAAPPDAALRARAAEVGLGALSDADLLIWDRACRAAPVRGADLRRPATREVPPAFGLQRPFSG